MGIVVKVTFEISAEAARTLKDLKDGLEEKRLPVKQWQIVEHLIESAKVGALIRHFEATVAERIGEDQHVIRKRRRERAAAKRRADKAAGKARRR